MLKKTPDRKNAPLALLTRQFDGGTSGAVEAREHVEMQRGDQLLTTELLRYNLDTEVVTMPGDLFYRDAVIYINGTSAEYNFLNESGQFNEVNYGLTGSSANGSAAEVLIDAGNHTLLRKLQFTTCPGESPQWVLTAKKLELDFEAGLGKARGAKLEFFDIPFLSSKKSIFF